MSDWRYGCMNKWMYIYLISNKYFIFYFFLLLINLDNVDG